MPRHSYKTALRTKGFRPIPADPRKLRSSLTTPGQHIFTPLRDTPEPVPMVLSVGGRLLKLVRRDA